MKTYCPKCRAEVDELRIVEEYKDGNLPQRRLLSRRYASEPCGCELTPEEYWLAAVPGLP